MGKASRWFRALLGAKRSSSDTPTGSAKAKNKRAASRSFDGGNDHSAAGTMGSSGAYAEAADANKHAIAVAAATAAVAEAALAAARAAAEVVRLTSGGGSRPSTGYAGGSDRRRQLAAVRIQSAFRAYLARRALRALKGLVKLQALVRGRIVRKQSADMLRRMQAMARIQARACSNRAYLSEPSYGNIKSTQPLQPGLAIPKRHNHQYPAYNTRFDGSTNLKNNADVEGTHWNPNWLDRWMEECTWNNSRETPRKTAGADDEKSDKILEVDTWKPHLNSQRSSNRSFQAPKRDQRFTTSDSSRRLSTNSQKPNPSLSSGEALSLRSLNFLAEVEQPAVWTAENSPQVYSAMSRPGSSARGSPFAPTRSECSRSVFGGYSGHPNYMANTESFQAKVRSQSAPKQRMQFLRPGSPKRFVHGLWDVDTCSERGFGSYANSKTKAYSGSSR